MITPREEPPELAVSNKDDHHNLDMEDDHPSQKEDDMAGTTEDDRYTSGVLEDRRVPEKARESTRYSEHPEEHGGQPVNLTPG